MATPCSEPLSGMVIVETTVLVAVSITLPAVWSDPYTNVPAGLTTSPRNPEFGIAVITVFDVASMTVVLPALSVTYTRVPAGFTATPAALATGIVVSTVLLVVSMTETVPLLKLPTYARVPAGFSATPNGPLPTGIVAI